MLTLLARIVTNKIFQKIFLLLLLFFIIFEYQLYKKPTQMRITYNAIEYQAGNPRIEKPIKLIINGSYHKKIFSNDTFGGTITIDGKKLRMDKLIVNENGQIIYAIDDITGTDFSYGIIYATTEMRSITISLLNNGEWSSSDGYMISAPSKDRTDALNISNCLLYKYLTKTMQ